MKAQYTLANGKKACAVPVSHTGYSVRDTVTWEFQSEDKLEDEEISFLIECERPSAGYGESQWHRTNAPGDSMWRVRVTSWASCD